MKIGKWISKLGQSSKVASIDVIGANDDGSRAEAVKVTLTADYATVNGTNRVGQFSTAHDVRLFVQRSRKVKLEKASADETPAPALNLATVGAVIAIEAKRNAQKTSRGKLAGQLAKLLGDEPLNTTPLGLSDSEMRVGLAEAMGS